MSRAVQSALGDCWLAEKRLREVLRHDYPVGATIRWKRNRGEHTGTVLSHNPYAARLQARNARTQKEVTIKAYEVLP